MLRADKVHRVKLELQERKDQQVRKALQEHKAHKVQLEQMA